MSNVTVGVVADSKLIGSLLQELNPIESVSYEAVEGSTFKGDFLIDTTNSEELKYLYKGKEVSSIEFFIEVKNQVLKIKEEEKEMRKLEKVEESTMKDYLNPEYRPTFTVATELTEDMKKERNVLSFVINHLITKVPEDNKITGVKTTVIEGKEIIQVTAE